MIQLTTADGRAVMLAPTSIASVEEALPSVRCNGTHAVVTMTDGRTIQARETVHAITKTSVQRSLAAPTGVVVNDYRTR